MRRQVTVFIVVTIAWIVLMWAVLFVAPPVVGAQDFSSGGMDRVDLNPIRPATELLCDMLRGQNVGVTRSYQNKSMWRADWGGPTVFTLSGGCYFYNHDLRLLSYAPLVLNGCRAPDTKSFLDADGNLPQWDKCYYHWFPRFESRPEVQLTDLLRDNKGVRAFWKAALNASGVNINRPEIQEIFNAMGLEDDGLPYQLMPDQTVSLLNVELVEPAPAWTPLVAAWYWYLKTVFNVVALVIAVAFVSIGLRRRRNKVSPVGEINWRS